MTAAHAPAHAALRAAPRRAAALRPPQSPRPPRAQHLEHAQALQRRAGATCTCPRALRRHRTTRKPPGVGDLPAPLLRSENRISFLQITCAHSKRLCVRAECHGPAHRCTAIALRRRHCNALYHRLRQQRKAGTPLRREKEHAYFALAKHACARALAWRRRCQEIVAAPHHWVVRESLTYPDRADPFHVSRGGHVRPGSLAPVTLLPEVRGVETRTQRPNAPQSRHLRFGRAVRTAYKYFTCKPDGSS